MEARFPAPGSAIYRYGRGMLSAAMAGLSLKVTIDSLSSGQHIECKDLDELLALRGRFVKLVSNVKAYLGTAQMFDGTEEVIAF